MNNFSPEGFSGPEEVSREELAASVLKEGGEENSQLQELLEKVKESAIELGKVRDGSNFLEINQAEKQMNDDIERFAKTAARVHMNFSIAEFEAIARKESEEFAKLSNTGTDHEPMLSLDEHFESSRKELETDIREYVNDLKKLGEAQTAEEKQGIKEMIVRKHNALSATKEAYAKSKQALRGGDIEAYRQEAQNMIDLQTEQFKQVS